METYEKAERRFVENLKLKEAKFQEEREEWEKKLEDAVKDEKQRYNALFLQTAMMKWRFIVSIIKLKTGGGDINEHIEEIMKNIMNSQVQRYLIQIE